MRPTPCPVAIVASVGEFILMAALTNVHVCPAPATVFSDGVEELWSKSCGQEAVKKLATGSR